MSLLRDEPAILRATRQGLRYAGLGLPVAVVSPSLVDHSLRCASMALILGEEFGAEREGRAPVIVERITMHECRHTFASLLIDSGANAKAIQQFMGHAKIQTTLDVYGHLLPGSHDEVRRRMDAYLRGEADEGECGASG